MSANTITTMGIISDKVYNQVPNKNRPQGLNLHF